MDWHDARLTPSKPTLPSLLVRVKRTPAHARSYSCWRRTNVLLLMLSLSPLCLCLGKTVPAAITSQPIKPYQLRETTKQWRAVHPSFWWLYSLLFCVFFFRREAVFCDCSRLPGQWFCHLSQYGWWIGLEDHQIWFQMAERYTNTSSSLPVFISLSPVRSRGYTCPAAS